MVTVYESDLICFIDGKKLAKKIKVEFFSNSARRIYEEIEKEIIVVYTNFNQIKLLENEITLLQAQQPEGYIEDIQKHVDRIKELSGKLENISLTEFEDRRIELLLKIFSTNGCTDSALLTREFWDECVHPAEINRILKEIAEKDFPKDKKKVAMQ